MSAVGTTSNDNSLARSTTHGRATVVVVRTLWLGNGDAYVLCWVQEAPPGTGADNGTWALRGSSVASSGALIGVGMSRAGTSVLVSGLLVRESVGAAISEGVSRSPGGGVGCCSGRGNDVSPSLDLSTCGSTVASSGVEMRDSSGGQVARPAREFSCSTGGDSIASSGVGMVAWGRSRRRRQRAYADMRRLESTTIRMRSQKFEKKQWQLMVPISVLADSKGR